MLSLSLILIARYSAAGVLNILNQEVKIERPVTVLQWRLFAKTEGDL